MGFIRLFDDQWSAVLADDPPIGYFKSSEAESLRPDGQWRGITKDQRDRKIDRLIEVISKCTRRAVCARVRQEDYNALVKGKVPSVMDSPYYFLMPAIISASINAERRIGELQPIDFIFDEDQKHEKQSKSMLPMIMHMKSLYGSLINVAYRDEKKFLPLQTADLVAWQIRRAMSVTEPTRRPFHDSRTAPSHPPETLVVDRSMVTDLINGLREEVQRLNMEVPK